MTRKDYEAIAAALKAAQVEGHGLNSASVKYVREQWELCCGYVADVMARDNPRFDRGRFLKAAGVQS